MTLALRGGTVVTAEGDVRADVLVDGEVIVAIGASLRGDTELDATGCHVLPGFVDLHTHLREPGREEAETIATGSRAGALGGYTALVAMPNTDPAQDSVSTVEYVRAQGRAAGLVEVVPSGCITVGRKGERLAPLADLAAAGVRVFTDDGNGVQDASLMRRAMLVARDLGVVLAQHCEVSSLTNSAVMDECACSGELGLPGWPSVAEELMVQRDIDLCRETRSRIHFLHLSTARSVALVRAAKSEGLAVTAEVAPHHLLLDHERLRSFDPVFKVNPPLRSAADAAALREGLRDGTIDAVATDHAPHPAWNKEVPLDEASPGMLGLHAALGVVGAALSPSPSDIARMMSTAPARIAGVSSRHGVLPSVGGAAHVCVADLSARWIGGERPTGSRSANDPWVGVPLVGTVRHTVYGGRATVVDGEVQR
jgi:dihydroorotase